MKFALGKDSCIYKRKITFGGQEMTVHAVKMWNVCLKAELLPSNGAFASTNCKMLKK